MTTLEDAKAVIDEIRKERYINGEHHSLVDNLENALHMYGWIWAY
jgi:hypothetical protein